VTHFRTSVTAPEADTRQLCATQLISRPGTLPSMTIPIVGGRTPDVDGVLRHLGESADFFGLPAPQRADLVVALSKFAGRGFIAATVTIVDARILVSGAAVTPWRPEAVRIAGDESAPHVHRASDPWWRRMAARTTSRGELDQCERWLNDRGYADGLSSGEPLLGALVFQTADGTVGVENAEPTSVLDQLRQCGVVAQLTKADACPRNADRAFWVSPRYETHPVAELAGVRFPVDVEAVPSFARWS
jgi:hypothetical protein